MLHISYTLVKVNLRVFGFFEKKNISEGNYS